MRDEDLPKGHGLDGHWELHPTHERGVSPTGFAMATQLKSGTLSQELGSYRDSTPFLRFSHRMKERTLCWYALPLKANLRKFLCSGRMLMWKYVSFWSTVTNQSLDWTGDTMSLSTNILSLYVLRVQYRKCRSKVGVNPLPFLRTR